MLPDTVLKPILENLLGKIVNNGNFQQQVAVFAKQWNELCERQARIETMLRTLLAAGQHSNGQNIRSIGHGGNGSGDPNPDTYRSGVDL